MDRKIVAAWASYDFANSVFSAVIMATVFSVYFADVVVGNDAGLGDLWWGRVLSTSMLIVALSSPVLGSVSDRAGVRKRMLFAYTTVCVGCVALFPTIAPGMILWGYALAVLANIGFEGALVYYNAYLPDIAPPDRQGFVSGIGFGTGYAGSAAGLLISLPLVARGWLDFTWWSVAAFFALFSVPALAMLPADRRGTQGVLRAAASGVTRFKQLASDVLKQRDLRRFLLSFFVYIDGVNTTIYFAAIFAKTTLGFTLQELIPLFLLIQLSALAGSFALARPTDVWGPKRTITLTLVLWTAIAGLAYFVTTKGEFVLIAVLAGTGLGAVQAASRALMSELIPKGKEAQMFGFYAFCGKSSSVVGPLVFGEISHALGGNQRVAVLSVVAFFLVGLLLLQRVHDPRSRSSRPDGRT
jgi:UMF1 family MFS transporter